ncbi:MAG: type II secretion system GspH family protein [Lactobacillus sp.]|jgi:prepilin-type N-terminal cleavage/methylation domain-containing protein|nr:type II secretion system GspH family protein [Lactobacillus sp.]
MEKFTKSKAFSLVESIVVLAIAALLVTWPAVNLQQYRQRMAFNRTIETVTSEIEYAKRYAILKEQTVKITNLPLKHELLVVYPGRGFKHVPFDKSVNVQMGRQNTFSIRGAGTTAPRTLGFEQNGKRKLVTMQLEWGKISFG